MKYYVPVGGTFTHMSVDPIPHKITKLVGDQHSDWTNIIHLLRTTTLTDRTSQAYRDNFQHHQT